MTVPCALLQFRDGFPLALRSYLRILSGSLY